MKGMTMRIRRREKVLYGLLVSIFFRVFYDQRRAMIFVLDFLSIFNLCSPTESMLANFACQTVRDFLMTPKSPSAYTNLYKSEKYKAERGMDGQFEDMCLIENACELLMNAHMPNGYVRGEDGKFYILPCLDPPKENVVETQEEFKDVFSIGEEPSWSNESGYKPAQYPPEHTHDLITPLQVKALICLGFAWTTVYWFGWLSFTIGTSVALLTFWGLVRLRGQQWVGDFSTFMICRKRE